MKKISIRTFIVLVVALFASCGSKVDQANVKNFKYHQGSGISTLDINGHSYIVTYDGGIIHDLSCKCLH